MNFFVKRKTDDVLSLQLLNINSMFQPNNLYDKYKERKLNDIFSRDLPEITKKTTLTRMNYAINLCEYWNSCLDIGCGNGHYLAPLSTKFKKCVGIEIDHLPGQREHEKKYPNISILNTSFETYKTHEKFDFVLLVDIFEHIPDVEAFVKKISHLQNDGGIVYIITPNPLFVGPASESQIFHTTTGYHGHIKHYTHKEVCDFMKRAGYSLEFNLFEETARRQKIKTIGWALSRRDQSWKKNPLYRIVRPLVLLLLKPVFMYMEKSSYAVENTYKDNQFVTMAQALTFKKDVKN